MNVLLLMGIAHATPLVLYSLEANDGGFAESGDTEQWEWGQVQNGPGGGVDGINAWSTGLSRDYLNDSVDYLHIPAPDLSGLDRPMFSFQHWYEISMGDVAWIEVDPGNGWTRVEPLYGYPFAEGFWGASGGWRTVVVDLSGYGSQPGVRLAFSSDLAGVATGWTVDEVAFHDGDVAAPKLTALSALADTDDLEGPYLIDVKAEDDTLVANVELHWDDGVSEHSVGMVAQDGAGWRGEIPAAAPDTVVSYWIEADDGLNTAREPEELNRSFRVYLPAPTDVVAPLGRVVGTSAALSWTAPDSRNAVLSYEVLAGDAVVVTSTTAHADVPLSGGEQSFSVRAVYAAGAGDRSALVTVDGIVPTLSGLVPDSAWPEDTIRLLLMGTYVVFVQDEVTVDLGGIEVVGVEVRDVDTAWVDVHVGADAAPGFRTLSLTSGDVTLTVPDAFQVLDGDGRPRLTRIEPDRVRQGDSTELVFTVAGTFQGTPSVDLGEGVVVESVTVDGATVTVECAVANDAPLGERLPTLDDGVRVLDGVSLEVADAVAPSANTCGTSVNPGAWLALLALGLLGRRRGG